MKLRFYQNSIRFRMQVSEVNEFAHSGLVSVFVQMGPKSEDHLAYSVQLSDVADPQVMYDDRGIKLLIPESIGRHWASSDEVGIYAEQKIGEEAVLKIILEKDFKCLDNTSEDQSNMFPNPKSSGE